MNPVTLNRVWARLILHSLRRAGVSDICIAPGSRSTPLTLEAEALKRDVPALRLHTHFDERGLGFLALGLAKASDNPVAVIVTSGTAVANLLPAVAESHLTREKLILLTADRPPELIQCGANQAISQVGIFGEHADVATHLPSPSASISPQWLLSTLCEGLHQQSERGGSYHINCPFPEPLYGDIEDASAYLAPVLTWLEGTEPYLRFTTSAPDILGVLDTWQALQHQKGVLIAGKMTQRERHAIEALANALQWPLLCDPQAGLGSDYSGFDVWLQNHQCKMLLEQANVVIQFGSRLVSKRLGQFISTFSGTFWLVDAHPGRLDPQHRNSLRIVASPENVAPLLCKTLAEPEQAGWGDALRSASERYHQTLTRRSGGLTELNLAASLKACLTNGSDLFIGNSMSVRLLDMASRLPDCAVFANRGASGIDGLIATAAGVQRARQCPMLMLMGDTSALYDLNSLALLSQNATPFVLVVINNNGGGIFDMLPVPDKSKDDYYRMPHGFDFFHAAAMFGLAYLCPQTLDDAVSQCREGLSRRGATLIEVKVPAGECGRELKSLFEAIANAELLG